MASFYLIVTARAQIGLSPLLSNTIKLGRTGSCDEMIRGHVRTLNKLNSPLIVARMKKYLVSKVYVFVFGGDAFFTEEQTKQQL